MTVESEVIETTKPAAETTTPVESKTPPTTPSTKESDDTATEESTLLGEGKSEESVKATPEKYEFKVPEGMQVDSEFIEQVSPVFKELGLNQEQAQKLADIYAPHMQKMVQTMEQEAVTAHKQQVETWKTETMKALGATAKEDIALAGKAMEKIGSPELREILNITGLGNHPEIVKAFVKVGKAISEDTFVEPSKTSNPSAESIIKKMYPSMSGKK